MAKVRKKFKYQEGGKNTQPPYQFYGNDVLVPYGGSGPVTNMLNEITLTDVAPRNNPELGFFNRMYPGGNPMYSNIQGYTGMLDQLTDVEGNAKFMGELVLGSLPYTGEALDAYYVSDALARGDKEEAAMYTANGIFTICICSYV